MKRIYFFAVVFLSLLLFATCTKYRDLPNKTYGTFTPPPAGTIGYGSLRINEFICKGISNSASTYLGGATAKWFELYNPTTAPITLTAGKWFITDTLGDSLKYQIPVDTAGAQWTVPAKGYMVIMCVKTGTTGSPGRINAPFSLSSSAGDIGIFYQDTTIHPAIRIDAIHYNFPSGALSGVSYGRLPDGQDPSSLQLSAVTPEAQNQ